MSNKYLRRGPKHVRTRWVFCIFAKNSEILTHHRYEIAKGR